MDTKQNFNEDPEELTKAQWDALLAKVSEKARKKAWSNGVPITIVRNNQVIELAEDGTYKVLQDLPESNRPVKLNTKRFRVE